MFNRSRLRRILRILTLPKLPIYYPLHEITRASLKRFGLLTELERIGARLLPPLSYLQFIRLLMDCNYVITDGGSIEEESLIFRKPCVLLRKRTERVESVRIGCSHVTRLDLETAADIIRRIEQGESPTHEFRNPYIANRSATELIARCLKRICS